MTGRMAYSDLTKQQLKEYRKVHLTIRKTYGNAMKCENPDCRTINPSRFEYALIKGRTYTDNIEDYRQLCVPCHRVYDITESTRNKMSVAKSGIKPSEKQLNALSIGREVTKKKIMQFTKDDKYIATFDSFIEAANFIKRTPSGISSCASGKISHHGGFIWKKI